MKIVKKAYNSLYSKSTILALLILVIVSSIVFRDDNFFSMSTLLNVLLKAAKTGGYLALGMTFVIISGEIDLSVGAVVALSGVVMGLVGAHNPFLGIAAGLIVGVVAGLSIGFMVTKMKISSWIASLATMFAVRGIIELISKKSVPIKGDILTFANTNFLKGVFSSFKSGISIQIPLLLITVLICMYVSHSTKYGMNLYATGGNKEAARMMGVDVNKTKVLAFVICSTLAAISGVLLASGSGSATLSVGKSYETTAIAIGAIAGVKLSGGQGKFSGTFFGMMIYFVINTVFTYLPYSVHLQSVIMGILVLLSVGLQSEVFSDVSFAKKKKAL